MSERMYRFYNFEDFEEFIIINEQEMKELLARVTSEVFRVAPSANPVEIENTESMIVLISLLLLERIA